MHAAQGLWHQWQRQAGALRGKGAAGGAALLVVMVVHGWAHGAGAGVAEAGIGDGTVSTASEGGNREP
jgi:hypothetical protein